MAVVALDPVDRADAHYRLARALLAAVPEPNPDRRLDLAALMAGRASQPDAWPEPFTVREGAGLRMVDIGNGHMVRASGVPTGEAA